MPETKTLVEKQIEGLHWLDTLIKSLAYNSDAQHEAMDAKSVLEETIADAQSASLTAEEIEVVAKLREAWSLWKKLPDRPHPYADMMNPLLRQAQALVMARLAERLHGEEKDDV